MKQWVKRGCGSTVELAKRKDTCNACDGPNISRSAAMAVVIWHYRQTRTAVGLGDIMDGRKGVGGWSCKM